MKPLKDLLHEPWYQIVSAPKEIYYVKLLEDLLHEPWYQIVSAPKEIYYVKLLEDLLHEPWPGTRSSQRLEGFIM
jgi:hypothetical protein